MAVSTMSAPNGTGDAVSRVRAVKATGSSRASKVCPATMLVSGTSAVGIRNSSRPATEVANRSSSNFGSCPVPVMVSRFTRYGTAYSV